MSIDPDSPGFYWIQDELGRRAVVEVMDVGGLCVLYCGRLYIDDLHEARAKLRFLGRVPELILPNAD
jgi:hypothetical protein